MAAAVRSRRRRCSGNIVRPHESGLRSPAARRSTAHPITYAASAPRTIPRPGTDGSPWPSARGPEPHWTPSAKPFGDVIRQLTEYFMGRRTTFDLKLHPKGTPFQPEVWKTLLTIPYGETRFYRQIARQIGRPRAVRAMGLAVGRNPLPIVVPSPGDRQFGPSGRVRRRTARQTGVARSRTGGQRDGARAYTTRPPAIVVLTAASLMRDGSMARMSSDRMTRSANMPALSLPFSPSANSAYAEPAV